MSHLYLPRINPGAGIAMPDTPAVWIDNDRRIIKDISDGIAIDESAGSREVSSIPDIYARPLTFLSALRSDNHPLRERTIQEWRGLISLLALHKFNTNLDRVTITPVSLGEETFSRALKNLAPSPIQLEKNGTRYKWTDILLIKYDDIPLGAFAPGTLVFTSADYHQRLKKTAFPLMDGNGYLKAPEKGDGIEFVGEWLEWFKREYNQQANTEESNTNKDYEYAGVLNAHLEDWIGEIRETLAVGAGEDIHSEEVNISEAPLEIASSSFLPRYNIYQLLLRPLVKNKDHVGKSNKSDYALLHKKGRNYPGYTEVVVITASELAKDKRLWEVTKPSQLNKDTVSLLTTFFKEASGTKINNVNLQNDNAIWIRPEMYFLTDVLLDSDNKQLLSESEQLLNGGDTRFVLPFKKEILHFFSPEDIQEILKPRFELSETGDKVTFYFYLPLIGGATIEIKKLYRHKGNNTGEGIIRSIKVPVLDIFPDYLGDFWSQYFVLNSSVSNEEKATPVNYANSYGIESISHSFEESNNGVSATTYHAEVIKLSGRNSFPEAFEIHKEGQPLGLILAKKEKPDNFSESETIVGIDFGTSNTNIYLLNQEMELAERLKFSFSQNVRSFTNADPSFRRKIAQYFFVPTEDVILPTPTALRIFNTGVHKNLLLDFFVFFPFDFKYPSNVQTNIKWDSDQYTALFIKSLLFLILVELVKERRGKVKFRFSFPKSFNIGKRSDYERVWRQALNGIGYEENNQEDLIDKIACITYGNGEYMTTGYGNFSIDNTIDSITEGVAAGEYFSSRKIIDDPAKRASRYDCDICLDIGGGTSDFSIWFNNDIQFDTSVLLAGKNIAAIFKTNPRIKRLLFSEKAVEALEEVKNNDILFSSRLNYILKKEEKQITSNLVKQINNQDIKWMRWMLTIEFAALSYYAAHLVLALNTKLSGRLTSSITESGIKLFFGGNAAKFISWIDFGDYSDSGFAAKFLKAVFANAINDKALEDKALKPFLTGLVQSPGHKDEASGGTVVHIPAGNFDQEEVLAEDEIDELTIGYGEENDDGRLKFVHGETLKIADKRYLPYDNVSDDLLFTATNECLFRETEMLQFDRFITIINGIGTKLGLINDSDKINLSLAQRNAIKQEIRSEILKQASYKKEQRLIEPVFISEVKLLFEYLFLKVK